MANVWRNDELNTLLINIGRSLLQYVGECWPWSAADAQDEQRIIRELMQRQQNHIVWLTDLLAARRTPIDFGTFPTEYTDLHYVALGFLLDQLVTAQEMLVDGVDDTLKFCSDDREAVAYLEQIAAGERHILDELKKLAANAGTHSV